MANRQRDLRITGSEVARLEGLVRQGGELWDHVPTLVKHLLTGERWRHFIDPTGQPHDPPDFVVFVTTPPLAGLGTTIDRLREAVRAAGDLDAITMLDTIDKATQRPRGRPRRENGNDVPNSLTGRPEGNTRQKALRRLRKDRPDLHDKVLAGEISAHAAMVEAGFRHHTITVPIDNVGSLVAALRRRLSDDQIGELRRLLK
jgi:hypothetical protein